MRVRLQKIIAAANGYTTRTVMGVAPTMLVSAAFANSTVPSGTATDAAPQVLLGDTSKIATTGPVRQLTNGNNGNGLIGAWTTSSGALYDGGSGWRTAMKCTGRYIEANVSRNGNVEKVRLRVNGQWAQAADYTAFSNASDFNRYQVRFDLGSAATRTIEFMWDNIGDIIGFNSDGTISLPDVNPADYAAAFIGDSLTAGRTPGLVHLRNTIAQRFGEEMGALDIVPMGIGGQGWVTTASGETILSRLIKDASRIAVPDIAWLHGSLNDRAASAATAQANIPLGLQYLQALWPNTFIGFFTGFASTNNPTDVAHFNAYKAGALAASDARTFVIDTSDFPIISSTGTLPNAAAKDSLDNQHPGPNETTYLVAQMRARAIAALQAL